MQIYSDMAKSRRMTTFIPHTLADKKRKELEEISFTDALSKGYTMS